MNLGYFKRMLITTIIVLGLTVLFASCNNKGPDIVIPSLSPEVSAVPTHGNGEIILPEDEFTPSESNSSVPTAEGSPSSLPNTGKPTDDVGSSTPTSTQKPTQSATVKTPAQTTEGAVKTPSPTKSPTPTKQPTPSPTKTPYKTGIFLPIDPNP